MRIESDKKLNRPGWRKIRGRGKKLVRNKYGEAAKDESGKIRYDITKVKTKEWEKVKK